MMAKAQQLRSAAEIQAEIDALQNELESNLSIEINQINATWEPLGYKLVAVAKIGKVKSSNPQISPAELAARKEKVKSWFQSTLKGGPKTIDDLKPLFEKVKESFGMKNFPKLNAYTDVVKVNGEKVSLK
jgi:hypothetical protein